MQQGHQSHMTQGKQCSSTAVNGLVTLDSHSTVHQYVSERHETYVPVTCDLAAVRS